VQKKKEKKRERTKIETRARRKVSEKREKKEVDVAYFRVVGHPSEGAHISAEGIFWVFRHASASV